MVIKYGFILRDEGFEGAASTYLKNPMLDMVITGVPTFPEACAEAKKMLADGVHFIELCGDFGEEHCKEIVAAVDGKIPVGYVTYLPEELEKLMKLFPN